MFHSARLTLTAWYLLIIMLVSITFSALIYRVLSGEVERFERTARFRIERRLEENNFFPKNGQFQIEPNPLFASPELVAETKQHILASLIALNAGIFILSGVLGYILAGRTLKPIQQMVDEQNQFVSDASHELKTPITSLKSAFEVHLRNKGRTLKEADVLVTESIDEVDKLQNLSEALLSLAQYQTPNNHMHFEKIALGEVLAESVHKVASLAKRKRIKISTNLAPIELWGDKFSLTELFVVFFDNAIKYSTAGKEVRIDAETKDGIAVIKITDQGIGIAPLDIPHIFDRFYRADKARGKGSTGGYGLGLAIAQKIVATHRGTIQVTSKINAGSIFTIRLPLKQQPQKA